MIMGSAQTSSGRSGPVLMTLAWQAFLNDDLPALGKTVIETSQT